MEVSSAARITLKQQSMLKKLLSAAIPTLASNVEK